MIRIREPNKDDKVFFKLIIDPEMSDEDIEWIKKCFLINKDNYIITNAPLEITTIDSN